MPFGTKAEISEGLARWLARGTDVESVAGDFLLFAELDIERELDLTFQDDTATGTITVEGELTLPSNCLYPTRLSIDTDPPQDVQIVTPLEMNNLRDRLSGDFPQYGYRLGEKIILSPSTSTVDKAYSLDFRKVIDNLADVGQGDTTELLTRLPDALLYGALIHAAPYLKADVRVGTFEARYARIIEGIKKLEFRKRTGGMVLRQRPFRVA